MSTSNQALRKPNTVREITKEIVIDCAGVATGDLDTGLTVPAGKFLTRALLSNQADDLTSGGSATLAVKVGSTAVVAATAIASVKGAGVAPAEDVVATFSATARKVYLTVATAALTAGTAVIKVSYI